MDFCVAGIELTPKLLQSRFLKVDLHFFDFSPQSSTVSIMLQTIVNETTFGSPIFFFCRRGKANYFLGTTLRNVDLEPMLLRRDAKKLEILAMTVVIIYTFGATPRNIQVTVVFLWCNTKKPNVMALFYIYRITILMKRKCRNAVLTIHLENTTL